MPQHNSQLVLLTWMSAAFPTGAFTCSHGLETAIADGRVNDESSCYNWIAGIVSNGSGWNDALLMQEAHRLVSDNEDMDCNVFAHALGEINDLALALCAGSERYRETTQLGAGFSAAAKVWLDGKTAASELIAGDLSLPVALGINAALASITLEDLIPATLQASSSNLVWIATRLVPLGQTQSLRIIAQLQTVVALTSTRLQTCNLNNLGSNTLAADLASLEHETLHSRICIT